MSKITDYAFLFQNSSGKSAFNPIGSFQLSQLNSSAVQSQLKAAGINTNSKQYKTVISKMMQNANGMMYTNPAAIKNLMKNYDKDGDYISPATGLAGMDATDIPNCKRRYYKTFRCVLPLSKVCKEAGQIKGDVDFRTI